MDIYKLITLVASILLCYSSFARDKWTPKQANEWYAKQTYPAGANYIPSDAINQIEMWSSSTFNPELIDKELSWAKQLGFNTMRVFLHDMIWESDREGFFNRVDKYLEIANKNGIKTMFVIFDSVWNPEPKLGKQPLPRAGVHNSGWVQSPKMSDVIDKSQWSKLERYVTELISRYKDDHRILVWDIYNEPLQGNGERFGDESAKFKPMLELLQKTFEWARLANPSQPITAGVFQNAPYSATDKHIANLLMLSESDVISFHCYDSKQDQKCIDNLKRFNRPIFCTEYMARPHSTFNPTLGIYKMNNVGAYNWGFVSGKTNTIYPWDSWQKTYTPLTFSKRFHDILNQDGTPFYPEEIEYIKSILKR